MEGSDCWRKGSRSFMESFDGLWRVFSTLCFVVVLLGFYDGSLS